MTDVARTDPEQGSPQEASPQEVSPQEVSQEVAPEPASPDGFRLAGTMPPVMRLSRKAMAGIGVVAAVVIGGSLVFALQPRAPQVAENLYDTDTPNRSEAVTGAPADYGAVPKLGPPLPGDLGGPIVAAQQDGEFVPLPPIAAPPPTPQPQADPQIEAAQQARERLVQERDGARTSRLFLGSDTVSREDRAVPPPIDASLASAGAVAPVGQAQPAPRQAFLDANTNRPTTSTHRLAPPLSPYVVQAGSVIPAALITGIRSDLPGQITAQVTQNVYDSPTGRILLIPQGARLVGQYDSEVIAGQNRVLLAWDRLLLPGGRSISLDRQPGADASGMAGLEDRTDYHWGQMLRAALVSTLLGVGAELATDDDSALVRALRTGTQDSVAQTGRQVVERQLGRAPTLTIRPGFSLRVIVTRDLVLEPAGNRQ